MLCSPVVGAIYFIAYSADLINTLSLTVDPATAARYKSAEVLVGSLLMKVFPDIVGEIITPVLASSVYIVMSSIFSKELSNIETPGISCGA